MKNIKYTGFKQFETLSLVSPNHFKDLNDTKRVPPYLSLFLETFNIQEVGLIYEKYINKSGNLISIPFYEFTNWQSKVSFGDFIDTHHTLDYINKEDPLEVAIAYTGGFSGEINVWLSGLDKDKVFLIDLDLDKKEFLSKNIFYFVRKQFDYCINPDSKFDFDSLTKYWGNQYWTPKGNEDVIPFDSHPIPGAPFYRYIPERGFTFIGTKRIEEQYDFSKLEKHIEVPFRLHTFLEHFQFEGEEGFLIEKIYDEEKGAVIEFGELIFEPMRLDGEKIKIGTFYKEPSFHDILDTLDSHPIWINHQMIPIGKTKRGYEIGVKIDETNPQKEEVWLVQDANVTGEAGNAIRLADDIFRFIRGLVPEYDDYYFDKIYQKWGDRYWRLKR